MVAIRGGIAIMVSDVEFVTSYSDMAEIFGVVSNHSVIASIRDAFVPYAR